MKLPLSCFLKFVHYLPLKSTELRWIYKNEYIYISKKVNPME